MGSAVIAVLVRKEKDLAQQFIDYRATSAASALSLAELHVEENGALRRLRSRAIIREASPGRYYLDEPSWQALRSRRRRAAVIVLLVIAVLAIGAAIMTRTGT